jgi:hypothetical protein
MSQSVVSDDCCCFCEWYSWSPIEVLTSLGLGIVEFLRERSVDSVETGVRSILVKAASKSFDIIEI